MSEVITSVNNLLLGCPVAGARFVDNADGTITDNETELMWEKKTEADGGGNFANLHDADNLYPWAGVCSVNTLKHCQPTAAAAALCAAAAENGTIDCDECTGGDGTCNATDTAWTLAVARNIAGFGGHTDWRVPTHAELISIIDYADTTFDPVVDVAFHGASCGGACTDITDPDCSCTQMGFYWSASTVAPGPPPRAWIVRFYDGILTYTNKDHTLYVRLVRGGS